MKEQSTDQSYKDVRVFKSQGLLSYLNLLIQIQKFTFLPNPWQFITIGWRVSTQPASVVIGAFFIDFLPSSLKGIFK